MFMDHFKMPKHSLDVVQVVKCTAVYRIIEFTRPNNYK